jgi:tyrosine-specific transport protein
MIARSPLSLSSSSQTNESATTNKPSFSTILNSALLISGTTIGGGFLSLPTVTGPIGFVPSSLTLFVVWLYLLLQSFVLVEAIQLTREDGLAKLQEAESLISTIDKNKISINNEKKQNITPGVASVGRHVFGRVGEVLIGILLTIIIEATLVSQISRAGLTLFNGQSYKIACAMSSISVALIVFGPKQGGLQFASKMNSILTFGFLLSIFAVFTCGIPSADFRCLGLTSALGNIQRSNLSDAIPIFLQLLVYGEIIPSVCELLNYESKAIRTAIVSGSFLTLCLQISWSALGISLLSPSVGADIITNDVLNMLIQKGGALKVPLLSLATTAILTTILGSYVALQSMINNIYSKISNVPTSKMTSASSNSLRQRLVVGSIISIPALLIASTSPTIFLKAIDFAGSYPVLLLWGILPPVTVLTQRLRIYRRTGSTSKVSSSGSSFWLMFLSIISSVMVGMNAKDDILRLIQNHLI